MGEGVIGKFIFFWIFILGGMFMGKLFGLTDNTPNTIMLFISLIIIFVGVNIIKANAKKKSAAKRAAQTPRNNNRHGKKKKK